MDSQQLLGIGQLSPEQQKHVKGTLSELKIKFWIEEFSRTPSIQFIRTELGLKHLPCLYNQNEFVRKAHNFALIHGSLCCVLQSIIFQYLCNAYDCEVDYNLQLALEGEEMSPSRKQQYLDVGVLGTQYLEQLFPEIQLFSTRQEPCLGLKISDRLRNVNWFQACSPGKLGCCPICSNTNTVLTAKQELDWEEFHSKWHDPNLETARKRSLSNMVVTDVNCCLDSENTLLLKSTKARIVL